MQLIRYRMKVMIQQKSLLFWSLVFPLLLGMLFYFMFGGISELEQFDKVPVGIVDDTSQQSEVTDVSSQVNAGLVTMMKDIKTQDNVSMFQVKEYTDRKQAEKDLEAEKIRGIIDVKDEYALMVKESDIYSSLIKTFIDQYRQNVALITDVAKEHPEQMETFIQSLLQEQETTIQEIELKGTDKDPYAQYFYALIAMTCLIGTMVGVSNGNDIQADLSCVGARRNVAPTPKLLQVAYDFIATYVLYCGIVALVIAVCVFVYGQDFGRNALLVLLGGWIGSFTAMAMGTVIAIFTKGPVQKKEGVCVAVFMISSFLAGLQWADITYLLEEKCPLINRVNPGTLIVNGFKSLSVFGDYRQYAVNMITLFVIGIICVLAAVLKLRRMRYESL